MVVKPLTLLTALLLTLPKGWCCLVAPCPASGKALPAPADRPAEAACTCCCCCDPEPARHRSSAPDGGQVPGCPSPSECSCADHDATSVRQSAEESPQPDFVGLIPVGDTGRRRSATGPLAADRPPTVPILPRHVLHCVWLC